MLMLAALLDGTDLSESKHHFCVLCRNPFWDGGGEGKQCNSREGRMEGEKEERERGKKSPF